MNRDGSEQMQVLNDETVADWLRTHADFLVRYPDVLAVLDIPHSTAGGAASLIERQVSVLREQLANERGRLEHLIARANEYSALLERLHELTLHLIVAPDIHHATTALETALREQFQADAVALKLFPVEGERPEADPLVHDFVAFIDRDRCLCGPLAADQGQALFGDAASDIRSAVLIPIRAHEQSGVLAIGSQDPSRFSPDMATDLLERLGAIAGAKIADLSHRQHAV
jgi:uncharacterized protein YigA (DUF484 family)